MLNSARHRNSSYAPRNLFASLLVLVLAGAISLTVYASVPKPVVDTSATYLLTSDDLPETIGVELKIPEPQQENQQANQRQSEKHSGGISLSDAVKAFNKKHNGNTLGNGIVFSGVDPQPLTIEEIETTLQRILDEANDEPDTDVPADLLTEIRGFAQSKRLPKHFSIRPNMGFTPNDFTKVTSWQIMLSYNVPDDRTRFRAFVIRDSRDEKNRRSDLNKTDESKGETETTDGTSLSDAISLYNKKHDYIEFGGIDPQPLTVEEVDAALQRIINESVDAEDETVPEIVMTEIRKIAKSKQLPKHVSISANMGITPNDFTRITAWRIILTYQVTDEKRSYWTFVIRDWGDEKNCHFDSKKTDESKRETEMTALLEFSSPFKLSGKVHGVDSELLKQSDGVVDALTIFKLDQEPIAFVDTGEAKIQPDGTYDLSYGMTADEAKQILTPGGKLVVGDLDFDEVSWSTVIIARLPGYFTRNLGTEIRDGTTKTLDLVLRPTTTISGTVFQNGNKPFNNASVCLLYTSPSPRDATLSRMPSSA